MELIDLEQNVEDIDLTVYRTNYAGIVVLCYDFYGLRKNMFLYFSCDWILRWDVIKM